MSPSPFEKLEKALESEGADGLFDALAKTLEERKQHALLFEALLMKKRRELGLPIQGGNVIRDLPDDLQVDVENYYINLCRTVGRKFLENGDIPGAWPYFQSIEEPGEVASAIDEWRPPDPNATETTGPGVEAIIEVALAQGANPERGFEMLLELHGLERALNALEHEVPRSSRVLEHCGRFFVLRTYADLLECVRTDVADREGAPSPDTDLRGLVESHAGLFEDFHLEERLIRGALRTAATLDDAEAIGRGVELAEYGRKFPVNHTSPDPAPFEDFYADVRIYLLALLGTGSDGAVRYFTEKAERAMSDAEGKHIPGEVLVTLLARLGRYGEALEAHKKHLTDAREPAPTVPTLLELCRKAGDYSSFLEQAREKGDLLQFVVGLLDRADR